MASDIENIVIEQYVASDGSPAEAYLLESGVEVWAIVAYAQGVNGDVRRVAADYGISVEAVKAALAYYRKHAKYIDARLLLNELHDRS